MKVILIGLMMLIPAMGFARVEFRGEELVIYRLTTSHGRIDPATNRPFYEEIDRLLKAGWVMSMREYTHLSNMITHIVLTKRPINYVPTRAPS